MDPKPERETRIRKLSTEETRAAFETDFISERVREYIARNPKAAPAQIRSVELGWRKTLALGHNVETMEEQAHTDIAERSERSSDNVSRKLGDLYRRVGSESLSPEEKTRLMKEIEMWEDQMALDERTAKEHRNLAKG